MSRSRGPALALLSAAVLLLQLVQTRLFSVMLWHHLTYLVVTFTLLGFAAGGAILACRDLGSRQGNVRIGIPRNGLHARPSELERLDRPIQPFEQRT